MDWASHRTSPSLSFSMSTIKAITIKYLLYRIAVRINRGRVSNVPRTVPGIQKMLKKKKKGARLRGGIFSSLIGLCVIRASSLPGISGEHAQGGFPVPEIS